MSMSFTDEEKRSLEDIRSTEYLGGAFVNFVSFFFLGLDVEIAHHTRRARAGTRSPHG
jgi:hypothetical protein